MEELFVILLIVWHVGQFFWSGVTEGRLSRFWMENSQEDYKTEKTWDHNLPTVSNYKLCDLLIVTHHQPNLRVDPG